MDNSKNRPTFMKSPYSDDIVANAIAICKVYNKNAEIKNTYNYGVKIVLSGNTWQNSIIY